MCELFGLISSDLLIFVDSGALDLGKGQSNNVKSCDKLVVISEYGFLHFKKIVVFALFVLIFGLKLLHLN